jgi:hypothetical protein
VRQNNDLTPLQYFACLVQVIETLSKKNDHTVFGEVAKELGEKYPGDEWTLKGLPWLH